MTTPANVSNVLTYSRNPPSIPSLQGTNVRLKNEGIPDFHALLESVWKDSSDAMRITDSEGTIVAVNNAYCRLVGKTREELVGELFTVAYDKTVDHRKLVERYRTRFDEKSVEPLMSRQMRLASGIDAFVESSNSYIEGSNGESNVLSIFRDATERRNVEMAFRASELRFRSVTQTAVNAIISTDSQSTITSWNDAARQIFGYDEREILGKSIVILMPERFRDAHLKGVERMQRAVEPQVIGKTVEIVGLRKDHREIPIEMSLSTWITSEGPAFGAIIREVSERKTRETELSTAAEMAKLGYWEYDVDSGNFTFSDQYFRLIHGSSAAKQGGNIMSAEEFARRLVHPEDAPLVGRALRDAIGSPDPNYFKKQDARVFRENGEIANVTVEFKVLKDSTGRTYKVVGANQDITERKSMERALERKRGLLRTVIDNLPDRVFAKDIDGKFIINNNAHILALGAQSQADVIGKSDLDFRNRDIAEEMVRDDLEVIHSGERILEKEEQSVDQSGISRSFLVTKVPMRDAQGAVVGLVGISRDITERKQAEESLQKHHKQLEEAQQIGQLGNWEWDVATNRTMWSDEMYRIFGRDSKSFDFTFEAFMGAPHPDDRAMVQEIVQKSFETHEPTDFDFRIITPNGELRWIHQKSAIVVDENGKPKRVFGTCQDITERKRAEATLREKEYMLTQSQRLAHIGSWGWDLKGPISWTEETYRVYGVSRETFTPGVESLFTLIHPEDRAMMQHWLEACGAGKSPGALEFRTIRPDGSVRSISGTGDLIYDNENRPIYMAGTVQDITERKAMETREQEHVTALKASQESLAELNAQKDRLFSILSHDLRSPFTSILGFCEILTDDDEVLSTAERKEFLGHIRNSAEKQMSLLNKLLDWSRLETGRITFDVRDLDISEVVKNSITAHLGTAKKKEITLQSTLPSNMKMRGDEVMLSQVFANLISNALKFTPANGLISVDLVQSGDDEWVVAVKDNGAGIPKEDFKKLFRIEEKYTRKGLRGEEGTGLGLSVVHEIVKKHSGSITVESEIGQGTVFSVRLPRLMEQTEYSVLVVDDDEGVRVLHSRFLKRIFPDARIIQASDGKEAFEMAKRFHPRIIITDYSMPEMNGFEFLNTLRKDPTTKDIPVLVITGKDSTASAEALRLSGAAAVLTKPVSSIQLQEAIQKATADKV